MGVSLGVFFPCKSKKKKKLWIGSRLREQTVNLFSTSSLLKKKSEICQFITRRTEEKVGFTWTGTISKHSPC